MTTLSIGRGVSNHIVLNDNLVSRFHAQLTILDNGKILLKDLGSTNGTFINGSRITEGFLNTGDIVKCSAVNINWKEILNKYSEKQQPIEKPPSQHKHIQENFAVPIAEKPQPLLIEKIIEESIISTPPKEEVLESNNEEKIKCPKCGSSNIHIDKKGFGGAKACCGGLACGPLGLLFGTKGANKLRKTCLKCNNSWS